MAIYKKEPGESNPTQFSPGQQNIVPVTQAQYNALTTAEKNNGTVYHITDKNISFASADQIDYDNSTSGLEATKVQGALDEINSDLSELNGMIPNGTTYLQPLLSNGSGNGKNIDNVGSTGGVPIGMVFCHSTEVTGTIPVSGDKHFFLLSLAANEGLVVQLAMPYVGDYNMAIRLYANNTWTTWVDINS